MAKKSKGFELDEYGFSDSLEIPDFGFDAPPVKDDRNPATKIAGAIATGAKAQVTSPAFIRDLVKKSLPRGYGEAMEFADSTAGSVKGLYNDAAKEIKPVIKDLRRTTKRLMPTLEATLPKSVSDKIKKWSEAEDRDLKSISAEQQREASIQMQLGEIFHLQAKADLQRDASTEARNVLKEGIDQGRHRDQLGQLDAMRISLQQMANYQSKIDSGFQRKSLELQFRSYFLAQEAFEEQKRFSVESKTHLEGILKNTALPEYAKLKGSERFAEVMRNKFINGVQDGLIGNRGGFVNKVAGKLSGVVKDKVSTYASNFKMALDGVDMAQDMNQMRREMGDNRSNAEFGGEMAGGMIADNLATRAGKRIRKMIPADGKIAKYGNKLRFGVRNAPQLMTDWANTDSWNTPTRTGPGGKILNTLDDNGIFGGLGSALKEAIRSANSVDNTLTGDKAGGMQDHAVFNRGASKSITEIIPGYLARIYRELQIMRTGNPNIDLSTYDFGSNKFSDKASVAKKILDSTVGTYDKERLKTDTDSALDEIDPDKKLTEEQRRLLAKHMLKDNTRNRSGSFKRLSNASEYSGPAGRHAEVYAELFAELAKKDPNGKKQNDFAEKFSRIGYSISDKRKDIQDHLNTGNREILEELGFIDKDTDQINMERIHSYLLGEDYTPGMATNGAAQFRSGSKLNKNVRRPSSPFEQVNPARPAGTGYRDTDDSTKVSGSTNGLISAIKESSAKAASETINETLLRIEKKINEGIDLRGGGDGTGGGSGGPNGKPGSGPWWNRSVKNLAGDAWGLGKKGFGKAKGFATDMFNRGVNLGGKGIGLGKDLFDKATEKWKGIKDVWIDGEFTPRLLAWKIKAGKYRDQATGAIIKSYKDIKGAVIDEDGNIILTAEQAREAFVKNGVVQKAIKLLGAGVGKIKDLGDRLMSKIPPAIKFAKDLAIKAYGLLKLPQDVYTKDKPDVPTLLAKTMKSGGYVSRITSKVIQNTDDIDGPVFDERGNEVLTADDFAKGLYDSKGRPIRNGFGKITGAAKDAFRFAKDKLTRGGKFLKDKVSGAWNMAKNALRDGIHIGGLGPGETRLDKDSLIIKRLTEIRNILDGRLPGKKKKIVGDIDSDGIREGSWADKMKKKKDAAVDKAKEMAAAAKDKGSSIFGMMSGGIGSLLSKLKGKDKDAEEGEDGKSLTEMAEQSLMDRFLGGGRNKDDKATGKKGRFGRFKDSAKGRFGKVKAGAKDKFGKARDSAKDKFGKVKDGARDRYGNMKNSAKNTIKHPGRNVGAKIGGGIGKALPFAGAALGAYGAYNAIQEGNYGEAALDAGLGLGSLAMSGGIAGAATGAGAAAGMLGSGAMALGGGFMTAGGVVLSGLGAVLASPVVLGALALAAVGTVGYLGYKYLTKKKLDIWSKVRYAQYGFLPTDEDRVGQVFGLEDKLMSAVKYDNGIAQLDETKLKVGDVMKDFKVDVENRKELSNWLTWFTKRFKPVFLTHLSVLNATAPGKTLNDIEKLKPEEKKKYLDGAKYPDGPYNVLVSPFPGSDSLAAGGTEVKNAVEAAQTEVTKLMEEAKKDGTDTAKEVGKAATVLGATGLALAATTPKGVDTTLDSSKLKQIIDKTGSSIGIDGKASILSVTGVAVGLDSYGSGRIDGITTIRYKTYGLKTLELEKVKAIDKLEVIISKKLTFAKENVASWKGSVEEVLKQVGPSFGVDGVANNEATAWIGWFNYRFLPVYLNYATALAKATNKQDLITAMSATSTQQKVDIAMAIYTTQSKNGMRSSSVWTVSQTPWPGYELNMDVKSIDTNMAGLKEVAKSTVLEEATSKKTDTGLNNKNAPTSLYDRAVSKSKEIAKGISAGAVKGATTGSPLGIVTGGALGGMRAILSGGREMSKTTAGSGGSIDDIPKPKGEGTWAALSDTIRAAAKMVGVDESLMAIMAAIESGFRTTVKAGTSSATGLYQFISGTWKTMVKKYGAKYGIDANTSPTDPRANALMGAEYIKENTEALSGSIGRPVTDTDVYLAHFLGAGGAKKLLKADPNAIAANILPAPARANTGIFYSKDGSPLTVSQVYSLINDKVRSKGKQFGLAIGGDGGEALVSKNTSPAPIVVAAAASTKPANIIPVSDQSPSLSKATTAPIVTTNAAPVSNASSYDPAVSAASSGFVSPRGRDVEAQRQYAKESVAESNGIVSKAMQESLVVQQGQLAILTKIHAIMSASKGNVKQASMDDDVVSKPQVISRGPAKEMPAAPVSMSKSS